MPLESLDRRPQAFFKRRASARSRLVALSLVAVTLMIADARFQLVSPLRAGIATVLYPAQWVALQPVRGIRYAAAYMTGLKSARLAQDEMQRRLLEQSLQAGQAEQLQLENAQLRGLLDMQARHSTPMQGARVLYDATDPYSRKVILDKGSLHGIASGAPVIDGRGLLGQVTRTYPIISEVSLLVEQDLSVPVVDTRSGVRAVLYGRAAAGGDALELRYMSGKEDVRVGDLLATSGIGGIYPPGLPVGRITVAESAGGSSFAQILVAPVARLDRVDLVMVLQPVDMPRLAEQRAAAQAELAGEARSPESEGVETEAVAPAADPAVPGVPAEPVP